ncbi:MAG: hypothetical protein RLY40_1173 [Pseudomonadota bacterium]|jgi:hypothetical protein
MLKKIVYLFCLFSVAAQADIKSHESYYSFLSQGFNIHKYQQCKQLIQSCRRDVFPDADCVEKMLQTKEACQQFAKLTSLLGSWFISVKQIANFSLITETFPGDGQRSYTILSNGHLINVYADPRDLDASLEKKYKKTSFFIVNWGEPKFQKNRDGSQNFLAKFKITDGCLACPSIAFATIEFRFSEIGNYLGPKLKSFKLTSDNLNNK